MTQPLLLNLTVIELPVQQATQRLLAVRVSSAIGLASDTEAPLWPWTNNPTWLAPWNWTLPTGVVAGHDWTVMIRPTGGAWADISAHATVIQPGDPTPPGLAGVLEDLYVNAPDAVLGTVKIMANPNPGPPPAWPIGEQPSSHGSGRSLRTALESLATQPGAIARPLKLVALIQVDRAAAADGSQLIAAPNFVMTVQAGKTLSFTPSAVVHDLSGTKPRTNWEYTVAGTGLAGGDVAPAAYAFAAPATLAANDVSSQWIPLTDTGGGHFTQDWESQIGDRFAAALDVPALLAASKSSLTGTAASSYGRWFAAASDAWSGVGIDIGPVAPPRLNYDPAKAIAAAIPAAMPLLRLMASNHGRTGEAMSRPDPTTLDLSWTMMSDRAETLLSGLGTWFATSPTLVDPPQTTSEIDTATRLAANWAQALRWLTTTPISAVGALAPSFWTALKQDRSIARGLIDLTTGGRSPVAAVTGAAGQNEAPVWLLVVNLQLVPTNAPAGTPGGVTLNLCRIGDPPVALGVVNIDGTGQAIWTPTGGVASAPMPTVGGACRLVLRLAWDKPSSGPIPAAYGYAVALVTPAAALTAMPQTVPMPVFSSGAAPALGRGHYVEFAAQAGQPTVTLIRAATTAVQVAGQFPPDAATLAGMQPRKQLARVATRAALAAAQAAVGAIAGRPTASDWASACSSQFDLALANLELAKPPLSPADVTALGVALASAQSSAAQGAFSPMRASNDSGQPPIELSADAPPILFGIAPPPQGDMIGLGVLARRPTGLWRSLNQATAWWETAGVLQSLPLDGAPQRGLSASGGSASLIRYDGRPFLVASPADAPGARAPTSLVLSRPAPLALPVPMPRFGESMDFAAYQIGPGGVLPPSMRTSDARPWEWDGHSGPPTLAPFVIEVPYRRTAALAAPRLDGPANASPIASPVDGFDALAGEVRNHPVEWAIANGAPVRFYRSRDRRNGVVDLKADAFGDSAWTAIEIDLLGVRGLTGDRILTLTLTPLDAAASNTRPSVSVTIAAAGADPLDLRVSLAPNSAANPAAPAIRRIDVDSLQYPESAAALTVQTSAVGAATAGLYAVELSLASADANATITLEPPAITVDGRAVPCPEASAPKPP